jgi:N-glycosylase/DNA lyase
MILPLDPRYPLNLEDTLLCGQAFRWRRSGDKFIGAVHRHAVEMQTRGMDLWLRSDMDDESLRSWVVRYLDLDCDYPAVIEAIDRDPLVHRAISEHFGLRLLRQEPFEALISFILSSNTNIPRIRRMVDGLSRTYGETIEHGEFTVRTFPAPEVLGRASERELRELGLGYRARYVKETSELVASGRMDLEGLRALSTDEARAALIGLPGVGPKVADCTLLYALGKNGAFPLDVWTKRALETFYFDGRPTRPHVLQGFVREYFGRFAGYAQLFIFAHAKTLWKEVYEGEGGSLRG